MKVNKYIDKMKNIQESLLTFIEEQDNIETNFNNLKSLLKDQKIQDNMHDLKSFIHLLIKISNNHQHMPNFYNKIDQILRQYEAEIKSSFTNSEIFNIFKSNKRILLFLIEEKVLVMNEFIARAILKNKFTKSKYSDFFAPEIKICLNLEAQQTNPSEQDENFEVKRKIGENDTCICEIIREDSVEEFKAYVEKENLKITSKIDFSIFETNSYLIKNQPTLIEYAAFCGSVQIVKYLFSNKVELTPSLWIYAVYSQNIELIHFLEENHIEPEDKTYEKCFIESIKCHHNDIAKYINDNLIKSENKNQSTIDSCCYQYYNFAFIQNDSISESFIFDLCRFGYYSLVYLILCNSMIDVNILYIQILIYFIQLRNIIF